MALTFDVEDESILSTIFKDSFPGIAQLFVYLTLLKNMLI